MKETFVNVKLCEPKLLRLFIFTSISKEKTDYILVKDDNEKIVLKLSKQISMQSLSIYEFILEQELELGHRYNLVIQHYGSFPVDVSEATTFEGFDDKYYYDGNDLGANYFKDYTEFVLWAPLASDVVIKIFDKKDNCKILNLVREDKGIYRIRVDGNLDGYSYLYEVVNNGVVVETIDPYAKASLANGRRSAIVDFEKINKNDEPYKLPIMESPNAAIIYEGHIRDLTIYPDSDVVNKGKYLGLQEKNRKTSTGFSVGFDYIKSLNITHLQLLPIYDYKTVDEYNPNAVYNWGYDPLQYFVPEGSYSTNPDDPYCRIIELKKMINEFHKAGIRIVMDVVYNHVFEYQYSSLEKVVPNYYFRRKNNGTGKIIATSGCGNDVASEKKMCRKLIVDACKHWIDNFDIDGFRYDLMGIIDVDTINQVTLYAKHKKPDFILYGEGWNMGGDFKPEFYGRSENYALMPHMGFFNDYFREIVKGSSFPDKIREPGYALGNVGLLQIFKYVLAGSSFKLIHDPKFDSTTRSINYVECHDNGTLYDKINAVYPNISEEEKLKYVLLINAIILVSYGVPFFHSGQEYGQTKFNHHNSYNAGDKYNMLDYSLAEKNAHIIRPFKDLCRLRRLFTFAHIGDLTLQDRLIDLIDLHNGGLLIKYIDVNQIKPYEEVLMFINPTKNPLYYSLNSDYQILFNNAGDVSKSKFYVKELMIPPVELQILTLQKEK